MKEIATGTDDFKKLIENDCYYVDKTIAIAEILQRKKEVVLFPRPRRFGKSLFISMLENFFDIDKKEENIHLFDGLAIQKNEYYKEFGEYPVIHLDFKDLKQDTYESVYNQFVFKIQEVYTQKEYLMGILNEGELERYTNIRDGKANADEYKNSIYQLSKWLERYYHKKTIILVDEYDIPIQEGYIKGFYEEVIELIRSVLSSALKGNDSLKFGVMTGVLRVSKESIFSDLNNPDVCDLMTKEYNDTFGFTGSETKELLEYYGLELTDEVKNMYDGYNFSETSIYNPWSILNYASKKVLEPYWMNTSGNVLIKKLLSDINERDKSMIEQLLKGESVSFFYDNRVTYQDFDETNDLSKVLNLLFASGYLTYDQDYTNPITNVTKKYFRIPNQEVKMEMTRMIESITFKKEIGIYPEYDEFMESIILGKKEVMENYLNDLLQSISYHDELENFYHGYMLGLFSGFLKQNYIIKSNREAGLGRYDVLIEKEDRSFGCIFEFKIAESENEMEKLASIAKEQMKEKEYYKELELDKVQNIKEYAVVFCGKKCIVR